MIAIIILDRFEITAPKSGRLNLFQCINFAIRYSYLILINLPFLGKPQRHTMEFLTDAYRQIYHKKFPLGRRIFYYLFGRKLIHIYYYNDVPVGFALFRTGPPGNIHLSSMGILEGCRGKGLSKPFLEESLTYWKKEGFRSTTLYVDNTNYIALKTYNSLGYLSKKNIINKIFMLKSL